MRCFLAALLFPFILFVATVAADPVSDAIHLATIASVNANLIYGSLNGTIMLNTSAMVLQMSTAIQGANTRLHVAGNSTITRNSTFIEASPLTQTYMNYLDDLHSMADACQRRGRLFHDESNLAVYQALQTLSRVVHTYGASLTSLHMIASQGIIRTMTAGSDIVDAQAAWVQNANYPGRRAARRRI
ncbi:hypothetical protein BDV97DRAFT_9731 [Delphinella strobiligena]|nr:hypothetical protein BDV97DRAFT_9731 [Delphinella strobiligena]